MPKTGVVWEEIYTQHVMSSYHPESPLRLIRIKDVVDRELKNGRVIRIPARPATKDEIAWVHDRDYIESIERTQGRTVKLDPDTTACPKTWEAALMSTGGVLELTEAVLGGKVNNGFAFVRPPGHHAERDRARGFCVFNNIAVAAEYAIKKHGLKRIAIVDFDIHHGNGTQNAFYNRSDVYYMSTHRWLFFPGSGSRLERGEGLGKGYTLNIPLERGDDAEFSEVYDDVFSPLIREYRPELLLVSAGYDAHEKDLLGGFSVTTDVYNTVTKKLLEAAEISCNGKMVMVLEGGYNVDALAECAEGALGCLSL